MWRVGWFSSCSRVVVAFSVGSHRRSSSERRIDVPSSLSPSTEPLTRAVTEWLNNEHKKSGSVFAVHRKDQEQLDKMQRYMEDVSEPTQDSGNAPLRGLFPFTFSEQVRRDVARHVRGREMSGNYFRTSLLCNTGTTGTGKTTLLQQTTVEAVQMLGQMVDEHVEAAVHVGSTLQETKREGDAEQHRRRPLGFFVTFNSPAADINCEEYYLTAATFPVLTAIALRVVYSVVVEPSIDYCAFAANMTKYFSLESDQTNFHCIVDALRAAWKWEGPMFVAIDELQKLLKNLSVQQLHNGLSNVCNGLLDHSKDLMVTPRVPHKVFSHYLAVSVYTAADAMDFSRISGRPLIVQLDRLFPNNTETAST